MPGRRLERRLALGSRRVWATSYSAFPTGFRQGPGMGHSRALLASNVDPLGNLSETASPEIVAVRRAAGAVQRPGHANNARPDAFSQVFFWAGRFTGSSRRSIVSEDEHDRAFLALLHREIADSIGLFAWQTNNRRLRCAAPLGPRTIGASRADRWRAWRSCCRCLCSMKGAW